MGKLSEKYEKSKIRWHMELLGHVAIEISEKPAHNMSKKMRLGLAFFFGRL